MDVAPLSQRVAAPDRVERPSSDGGLVWRAATLDDVTGIQRCEVQIAAVDHPHYVTSVEELEDDFGHSFVDVERDTTVVLEGDEVVAWGLVLELPGQETLVRVIL